MSRLGLTPPRLPDGLLVSVRSVAEADEALAGGASIIDVKEPRRGPLGRADAEIAVGVGRLIGDRGCMTIACGELADGAESIAAHVAAVVAGLAVAPRAVLMAAKAGPAGMPLDRWRRAYERLAGRLGQVAGGVEAVAVAYADAPAAGSPDPVGMIEAAAAAGAATILIDTYDKTMAGLLERDGLAPVREWVAAAHAGGMRVALAGRLTVAEVAVVAGLGADVVGVRSAACGGSRLGRVGRGHVASIVGTLTAARPVGGGSPSRRFPEESAREVDGSPHSAWPR